MERIHNADNGVSMQLIDLNEMPPDLVETTDVTQKPKDDVPLPPALSIELCFHKEDMEALKQKYKVLGSTEVADRAYFKNLGFGGGTHTLMFFKGKRVKYHGKSLHTLARSWFKTGVTEKEKPVNDYDEETIAATELFREFVKQASNDKACSAQKERERKGKGKGKGKGKEKVQEHVLYPSWPLNAKKKRKHVRNFNGKLSIN